MMILTIVFNGTTDLSLGFYEPVMRSSFGLSIQTSPAMCAVSFASRFQEHREPTLYATDEYTGHSLPGGQLAMSLHDQWLATAGRDGRLTFRQVETLVCCHALVSSVLSLD